VDGDAGVVVEGAAGAFWAVVEAPDPVVVDRVPVIVRADLLQPATVKAANAKRVDKVSNPFLIVIPPSSHYRTHVP
jgi:hypothetical protein